MPASGFYEWKKLDAKNKQPYGFDLANGSMLAFAGLWDGWKDPANENWLQTYTIITTDANELMAPVHNRMPVILRPQDYDRWLEGLAPHEPTSQYLHNRTGEDNADAHMKRQIMGREVVVAITAGRLDFGPWEQIFYGEFDGRRRKRALVKIIGD